MRAVLNSFGSLLCSLGPPRLDLLADGSFKLVLRHVKLVMLLEVHPVFRRGAEVPRKTQCGFSANSTRAIDDRGDAVGGDVERLCEPGRERGSIAAALTSLAASPALALMHRYETSLHLVYQRSLHNLLLLRALAVPTNLIPFPNTPAAPPVWIRQPTSPRFKTMRSNIFSAQNRECQRAACSITNRTHHWTVRPCSFDLPRRSRAPRGARTHACRVDIRVDAWSYHMLLAAPPLCGAAPEFPAAHAKIKDGAAAHRFAGSGDSRALAHGQ